MWSGGMERSYLKVSAPDPPYYILIFISEPPLGPFFFYIIIPKKNKRISPSGG